jgi:hypothetical protein
MSTEPTDAELLDVAKRATGRRTEDRLAQCAANTLGSAILLGTIGAPELVAPSPKCANDWCLWRLVLDRERARGVCDSCADDTFRKTRRLELQERIPAPFREHSLERPSSFIDPRHVDAARAWLAGSAHLLTIGSAGGLTGSGKTTLAGMVGMSAALRGVDLLWVHASELNAYDHAESAKAVFGKIVKAPFVLLDGLGKEIAGASDHAADIVSRRKALTIELIQLLHERRGPWERKRIVLTCDLVNSQIEKLYGPDALRRLCAKSSGATVIVLTRNDALDVVRL